MAGSGHLCHSKVAPLLPASLPRPLHGQGAQAGRPRAPWPPFPPALSPLALPASWDGHALVNIRKFSGVLHRSLRELIEPDMLDLPTARFLQSGVRSGLSILVAGAVPTSS
jgi:hypothetical protein